MASRRSTKSISLLHNFFQCIGGFVADHPYTIILVVVLLTVLSSLKLLSVKWKDDLKLGYTPKGARAFNELEVFRSFNDGKDPVVAIIIIMAKDGGSMARVEHLNETVDIVDYVGTHFPVKNYTYYRMCKGFCDINEPIRQFRNGFLLNSAKRFDINNNSSNNNSSNITNTLNGSSGIDLINLSFPIMHFFGRDLDLSPYFFGVEQYTSDDVNRIPGTNIKFIKLVTLHFRTQQPNEWNTDDTFHWERLVGNYFRNEYNSTLIRPMVFSLAYTQDEIVRAGLALTPCIGIGFMIMCAFAIGTVSIGSAYMKQFSITKMVYAFVGCITPLMATSTAAGLLFLLGLRPGSILCVTPFLVLAIGVDDAFIMINAWNRTNAQLRNQTASYETIRERMIAVLTHIGPSITITSLTNMLAFGIGIFTTPTPEIQLLCIANAAAILLDYAYTITLFAAVMCVGGRMELRWSTEAEVVSVVQKSQDKLSTVGTFLQNYFEWLSSGFTTTLVFILLVLYWIASIRGALIAKGHLTPEKLFLSDSPMIEVSQLYNKIIMPSYTFVTLFVTDPGDLRNSSKRDRVKQVVTQFEALPRSRSSRFTRFWLRDYEIYLKTKNEEIDDDSYTSDDLRKFLEWPEYESWSGFMKFDNQTNRLIAFYVTITYHGENQSDWMQRLNMLKMWRAVADHYKDIGASVYEEEALFTDQIETLVPMTLQTSLVILATMAVVCYIFMSNFFTVLVAILSVTSICIGVFGFLTLWNVNVDPVSMATIIMSIGMSVDFPAHITFHYYRTGQNSDSICAQEGIINSFSAIGFPLLQCSISTVLLILVLLLVPSYMSEVFTKAIVLVIALGTIHALIVIPALLCALSNINRRCHPVIQQQTMTDLETACATQQSVFTHTVVSLPIIESSVR